jgi:hypothetical protein
MKAACNVLRLVSGLSSERVRWDAASVDALDAYEALLGDSLVGAAFLVYAGYYDEAARDHLLNAWQRSCELPVRTELHFPQVHHAFSIIP